MKNQNNEIGPRGYYGSNNYKIVNDETILLVKFYFLSSWEPVKSFLLNFWASIFISLCLVSTSKIQVCFLFCKCKVFKIRKH